MNLSEIDWGRDSAEEDYNLLQYYVTTDSLNRLYEFRKSIIVGRKGAGKSAIRKKLINKFEQEDYHIVDIVPSFNMMQNILQEDTINSGFNSEILFQYVWLTYFFESALIKIGGKLNNKFCNNSEKFARELAKSKNQLKLDLLEVITDVIGKMKVKAGNLGEFGINLEKSLIQITNIETLKFNLKELAENNHKVVFMVDDLDLGWNNSSVANNFLLGLLTSINQVQQLSENLHVFVFLREDIFNILLTKTQHSDKYRDIEMIKWDNDKLKLLLSKRIEYNFKKRNLSYEGDLFNLVFPVTIGKNNTDKWLIERTLNRPRELIQLARIYTEKNETGTSNSEILKQAEEEYSKWKLDDLCTEFQYQYPKLRDIFNYWQKEFYRCKYHLTKDEISNIIRKIFEYLDCDVDWYKNLKLKNDIDGFLKILYQIGFLGDFIQGGQGGNKVLYSYTETQEPKLKEVQIHPCFRKALGTVQRNRKKEQK